MRKFASFIILSVICFMLIACSDDNPAESMYGHLEEAVQIEKAVEGKQTPLADAENDEYDLYEEMLSLSDLEEIESLSKQAIESAEKRRTLVQEEKAIIDEAYEQFLLSVPFIEAFEEEAIQSQAEEMVEVMKDRYETYQELYSEYVATIDLDVRLYTLVYQEDLTIDQLQEQHDLVNEAYQRINDLNQRFNEYTSSFNDAKRSFYDVADLDVVFDDA
ncbi:Putative cell-wall binding lipoprotein [Evansella caseinilytica]|uniref:Putative cell-wall binding lipoprotein n=1 Tax=Evansella caseinilytica TaxID=1503961 RepID=A0A1H3MP43_9BACI|nr:YkyA family protein [Evansella caseinilytica]SDY78502.1 Putative cell-wall binding lipoprotein [Evansella caseinilytica]